MSHRKHGKHRNGAITDGYNSDLFNVPQRSSSARLLPEGRKKSQKLRKGAITDGGVWGRLRREIVQNLVQNYSMVPQRSSSARLLPEGRKKLQKLRKGAITDGNILESPEGEKLQENLIQNSTKYKAITDGRIKVTQRSASRRVTLATGGTQENTESTEMGPSQMAIDGVA